MVVEEEQPEIRGKKRPRVEPVRWEPDTPEPKPVQKEPDGSGSSQTESERIEDEVTEFGVNFAKPDQIKEELLGILSDADELTEDYSAIQDLDSVINSLQDELNKPQNESTDPPETEISPASQPDLGYLLAASDDELGLPPMTPSLAKESENAATTAAKVEFPANSSENVNFEKIFECEDEFPSYDCGGFVGEESPNGDFVLEGLFSYGDREPSDQSEFPWQQRLPANPAALTG